MRAFKFFYRMSVSIVTTNVCVMLMLENICIAGGLNFCIIYAFLNYNLTIQQLYNSGENTRKIHEHFVQKFHVDNNVKISCLSLKHKDIIFFIFKYT
jgi:hypothetical protein